jgi:hypothetical protein
MDLKLDMDKPADRENCAGQFSICRWEKNAKAKGMVEILSSLSGKLVVDSPSHWFLLSAGDLRELRPQIPYW